MAKKREARCQLPFLTAFTLAAIVVLSIAALHAQQIEVAEVSNETKPPKIKIVSTEFKFVPSTVRVPAGRAVTLVLDNSRGETEHVLFVPAFGFRLEANAGEITRKTFVFDKTGEYEFHCDLPGHHEAGMIGVVLTAAP
jgi:uncharacterized cupredoxin-like copper-binding protein